MISRAGAVKVMDFGIARTLADTTGGNRLTQTAGLTPRSPTCRPRIHDLRHTFAVNALLGWYRAGVDVQARLPLLSTYLGHVEPGCTYWYLTGVPELMALAAERFERFAAGLPGDKR